MRVWGWRSRWASKAREGGGGERSKGEHAPRQSSRARWCGCAPPGRALPPGLPSCGGGGVSSPLSSLERRIVELDVIDCWLVPGPVLRVGGACVCVYVCVMQARGHTRACALHHHHHHPPTPPTPLPHPPANPPGPPPTPPAPPALARACSMTRRCSAWNQARSLYQASSARFMAQSSAGASVPCAHRVGWLGGRVGGWVGGVGGWGGRRGVHVKGEPRGRAHPRCAPRTKSRWWRLRLPASL